MEAQVIPGMAAVELRRAVVARLVFPMMSQSETSEPQTTAELADEQIARYRRAIKDGTGNPAVCRDMIDRWLDHRIDHGDEPRQPL